MKNLSIFLTLVIILLVMAACGSDDTVGSETNPSAETETVTPSPEPESEEEAEAIAESLDSETMDSETGAEDTPADPTPTVAAAVEESAEEDGEPVEESTPEGDELTSAGNGWGASQSTAQSACDHPYFPMRAGSTWSYSDGANTLTWEVVEVQGDLERATAQMRATIGDVTIDYTWDCAANEGLASFDFANVGFAPGGIEMTIEQQGGDGVFLLPADQLQPGESWTMNVDSTFAFVQTTGDSDIEVAGEMSNEQQNTVLSTNPVTFEDQTVDGVQFEQISTIAMTMTVLGSAVDQTINGSGIFELGRGIGMVSQSNSTDLGTSTMELVSYFVP